MSGWFLIGLCSAVLLCPSAKAEKNRTLPMEFLESLNAVKDALLEKWSAEIQDKRNVLIFPVSVAQQFLLEHALRLPEGSPEKTQLAKFIRNETQSPIVLDLLQYTETAFDQLTIQTFYKDTLPEMNATTDDPLYFSYSAFVQWSKERQDSVGGERGTSRGPLVTVAALRINSIQSVNFTWTETMDFVVSENQTIVTKTLMNVGWYEYAEFSYPQLENCTVGALRVQVNEELSMIFLLPLNASDADCTSSENLLKVFQQTNLETISFKRQIMFVNIPVLRVATVVNSAKKLTEMGLLTPEPHPQPTFAGSYESASLIFNPEVPKDAPIPMISMRTPRFQAKRPFLLAVLQKENPAPVLYGLIQNPNAKF